jgi:hypothetical protein
MGRGRFIFNPFPYYNISSYGLQTGCGSHIGHTWFILDKQTGFCYDVIVPVIDNGMIWKIILPQL